MNGTVIILNGDSKIVRMGYETVSGAGSFWFGMDKELFIRFRASSRSQKKEQRKKQPFYKKEKKKRGSDLHRFEFVLYSK